MDKLIIKGPNKLKGEVRISSSKNACLPILAASLLFPQDIRFKNLPGLSDIEFFIKILESMGASSQADGESLIISTANLHNVHADYELVRKMRASVLVLGPLLSRFKEAKVSLPGGCAIGSRPVDIHLKGMELLGAKIEISKGYIIAHTDGLKGCKIPLDFPSVGATENLMMAAVWAEGETTIENAAREPEIVDLANFLRQFGCEIKGDGSSRIKIKGRDFKDYEVTSQNSYQIIGDRIEAATYIIAALMTNSQIKVLNFDPEHLASVIEILKKMGAKIETIPQGVEVLPSGKLKGAKVDTAPFPGFPTDVQAQLMALMGVADGLSYIRENIFENRFMHVPELVRMGMDIELDGSSAIVVGEEHISGAPVMCTDLRASAALILAALVAKGETEISRIYHLDRGYEKLAEKFKLLGAQIERVKE
ncbi:MAG: UDP-N-acetylglucosamine 1-carboxyvinyltransferase [Halobacteriovoraceae bacterium]|nr:UDP-N-acetylglucosamine 1-carboxyvinyltransferase [Halobacteriovoraceae bacterium]|tara:strand:- start:6530 stop:7798 length:1269 start_codon:yes stop_codon:yes gene_type:complete